MSDTSEGTIEGSRGRARATFLEVVNEATTREKVRELVDQALNLNGLVYGHCSSCGKRTQVEVGDVKRRVEALVALREQAEGKPSSEAGETMIIIERPALRRCGCPYADCSTATDIPALGPA